jgi:hypothetical protein
MDNNIRVQMQPELLFLLDSIQSRKKSIEGKKNYYRKFSFFVYISTAVLATFTTILSGLKIPNEIWLEVTRIAIMFFTTLITLINAYSAFYSPKKLWISNNESLNQFYKLEFDIEYAIKKSNEISAEDVDAFKTEYQSILDSLNHTWTNSRKQINK